MSETVKLRGGYTYLEAVDEETGRWLTAKPKHKAKLDLYWNPANPLSIVLSGKYVSEVYRSKDNTRSVPEYWTLNAKAEYAWARFSLFTEINGDGFSERRADDDAGERKNDQENGCVNTDL